MKSVDRDHSQPGQECLQIKFQERRLKPGITAADDQTRVLEPHADHIIIQQAYQVSWKGSKARHGYYEEDCHTRAPLESHADHIIIQQAYQAS